MYGVNAFIMPQPSSGEAGVSPVANPKFVILIGTNRIFIHPHVGNLVNYCSSVKGVSDINVA